MLGDVIVLCCRRRPAPVIHATNHVGHEKRVACFFFACMWLCSYSYGVLLGSPLGHWRFAIM